MFSEHVRKFHVLPVNACFVLCAKGKGCGYKYRTEENTNYGNGRKKYFHNEVEDQLIKNAHVLQSNAAPLFEVRLELYKDDLRYNPSLEVGGDQGFLELVENLMNEIYDSAKFIPRLAKGKLSYKVSSTVT